jgi:C_GCAxxG_C_C family probable redox protein
MVNLSQEDMKLIAEKAGMLYMQGQSCSQSVGLALKQAGLSVSDDVLNAMSGLRGGIGGRGCVCGALMGPVLIAGAKDPSKAHRVSAQMHNDFKDKFKTTCCKALRMQGDCSQYVRFMTEKALQLLG